MSLISDVPERALARGDRLEPHVGMPDVGVVDSLVLAEGESITLLFWRRRSETACQHRNPVFAEHLGTSPEMVLTIDWQHCLSLGIWKQILSLFVQVLFENDVWRTRATTVESRAEKSTDCMKADLFKWYASEKARGNHPTEVQTLVPTMFGTPSSPCFALHGSETNHFMMFALHLVETFSVRIPNGDLWRDILDACVQIMVIIHAVPIGPMPPHLIQECSDLAVRIARRSEALAIEGLIKNHMLFEMVVGMHRHGAPTAYACWTDETLNAPLKAMANVISKSAHHAFERRLLEQWESRRVRHARR